MNARLVFTALIFFLTTAGLAYDWGPVGMAGITTTCIETDEDQNRLLVGTHEGFHIHDLINGTWTEFDDEDWLGRQVYAIQWDHEDPLRLITGRENAFWKGYIELTEDGGATNSLLHMSPGGAFVDLEWDWQYYYACGISDITPGELLRSTDGMAPWTPLTGHGHTSMTAIAIGLGGDGLFVAGDAGVWRSDDQGDTWIDVSEGLAPGPVHCLLTYWPSGDAIVNTLLVGDQNGLCQGPGHADYWWPVLEDEPCRRTTVMWVGAPWPYNRINRLVAITLDGRVLVQNNYDNGWTDETGNLPSPAVDATFWPDDDGLYVATASDGVFRVFPVISGFEDVPPALSLDLHAWPNPFNPRVNLSFQLRDASNGRLAVYDLRGRLVDILHEGPMAVGSTTVTWDATNQASGVYLARLECTQGMVSTRLVLVR